MSEKLLKLADKMAADIWLDENDGHGKYCYFCREFMSDGHAYDCPAWLYLEERRKPAEAAPAPEQSDRERANNLTSEWYRTAALLPGDEPLDWLNEHIASLLAAVRAEERERCQKVLSRQLEYIEAARALQRKLNGIFPNHRPLYHANGGLCREADYHKELKDLNHALDEVAAAIRKGEP